MYQVLTFSVIFLALIGVVEVVRALLLAFFPPKKGTNYLLVVPLFGHIEDVEYILRNAALRARLIGGAGYSSLIVLDCGMDKETKDICAAVCDELGYSFLFTREEFEDIFIS